jgi:hypothetical protein
VPDTPLPDINAFLLEDDFIDDISVYDRGWSLPQGEYSAALLLDATEFWSTDRELPVDLHMKLAQCGVLVEDLERTFKRRLQAVKASLVHIN